MAWLEAERVDVGEFVPENEPAALALCDTRAEEEREGEALALRVLVSEAEPVLHIEAEGV